MEVNEMLHTDHDSTTNDAEELTQAPQDIIAAALALPGVMWAILYVCRGRARAWTSAAQGGMVPRVLQGLALPGDRLPPVISHALRRGTIEQSRFFSVWLRSELGRDLSDAELDALSSLIALPLYPDLDMTALLLLGCRERDPDMQVFETFRSRLGDTAVPRSNITGQDTPVLAARQEAGDPLAPVYLLLDREVAAFHAFLAIEMKRAVRYQRNLSLLTFTVGHPRITPVLETVILGVAQTLRGRLRRTDTVGRAGPNIIGVVLPETSEGTARWLSPRLRLAVLRYLVSLDPDYTLEIGVAAKPRPNDTPKDLIAWALQHVIESPLAIHYQVS